MAKRGGAVKEERRNFLGRTIVTLQGGKNRMVWKKGRRRLTKKNKTKKALFQLTREPPITQRGGQGIEKKERHSVLSRAKIDSLSGKRQRLLSSGARMKTSPKKGKGNSIRKSMNGGGGKGYFSMLKKRKNPIISFVHKTEKGKSPATSINAYEEGVRVRNWKETAS